jgi:hypothetical protein
MLQVLLMSLPNKRETTPPLGFEGIGESFQNKIHDFGIFRQRGKFLGLKDQIFWAKNCHF